MYSHLCKLNEEHDDEPNVPRPFFSAVPNVPTNPPTYEQEMVACTHFRGEVNEVIDKNKYQETPASPRKICQAVLGGENIRNRPCATNRQYSIPTSTDFRFIPGFSINIYTMEK